MSQGYENVYIHRYVFCNKTSLVAQTVKASAYNAGDLGSIPGSGRSPWKRKWQPTPVLLPGKSQGPTEEPGGLQSMGSPRVGHDWATSLSMIKISKIIMKWNKSTKICTYTWEFTVAVSAHRRTSCDNSRADSWSLFFFFKPLSYHCLFQTTV